MTLLNESSEYIFKRKTVYYCADDIQTLLLYTLLTIYFVSIVCKSTRPMSQHIILDPHGHIIVVQECYDDEIDSLDTRSELRSNFGSQQLGSKDLEKHMEQHYQIENMISGDRDAGYYYDPLRNLGSKAGNSAHLMFKDKHAS